MYMDKEKRTKHCLIVLLAKLSSILILVLSLFGSGNTLCDL